MSYFGNAPLDGLINSAGILKMTEIDNYQEDVLDEIWEVNVKGPLRLTHYAFKHLVVVDVC
jgi:NAD(P)-dependent dehydrogenase (short-subunit alcohol dehydrogenase family)